MLSAYLYKLHALSIGRAESRGKERRVSMADLQEIVGRIIRQERQRNGLTIKELGEKAGLSEIYVGEIERGQKYPSAKVLESIATALDLDLAELLELMAEEIRHEREPQMTNAIGFTVPRPGQPRRLTVKNILNMLDEGDVESVADFSAFLLSKHLTPTH
jgi:transcriptional regulator with XRE-family HTH domain